MAGKIDSELIGFLHKMLDTLGAPALHEDLDKLNEDVATDIKNDDGNNVPEKPLEKPSDGADDTPVKPAAGAPVVSTSKP